MKKLSDLIIEQNKYIPLVCNGNGTCGKCRVRITEEAFSLSEKVSMENSKGISELSDCERRLLCEGEIEDGIRLACQTYVPDDFDISDVEILSIEEDISIGDGTDISGCSVTDKSMGYCNDTEADSDTARDNDSYSDNENGSEANTEYVLRSGRAGALCAAIDIGTTTIQCALTDTQGRVLDTVSGINHQRSFGADVISRIDSAIRGNASKLKDVIVSDLNMLMTRLLRTVGDEAGISRVVISANTTMIHLLLGFDASGLGRYPFTVADLAPANVSGGAIFTDKRLVGSKVDFMPGISAYIGGDIVSGIYYLGLDRSAKNTLLLDLGTNGELALATGGSIMVASTSAGPAFEGGKLSNGVASIPGAISGVRISAGGRVKYETIDGRTPVGICGSGMVDTVSELRKNALIDENGTFTDEEMTEFKLAGKIGVSQSDIRELQMAKAAIRTGIDILLSESGLKTADIDCVALAGGFGKNVNPVSLSNIGLIDKSLLGVTEACGNTSLLGAIKYLVRSNDNTGEYDRLRMIGECSREVVLSNHKDFNEMYIKNMGI